jgi:hypothetical protein
MRTAYINGRWPIKLPEHRARFHEERPWWEAARLADMHAYTWFWSPVRLIDIGSEEGDLTALYASWGFEVAFIDPSKAWIRQTHDILTANGLPFGPSFTGLADNRVELTVKTVDEPRFVTMDEPVGRTTLDNFCEYFDFYPTPCRWMWKAPSSEF